MSAIALRHVWKTYEGQVVLENLSLTIDSGEFCTLVGASGCGKSTFLRMLLGAERPTRGEILIDGRPLPDEPDAQRGIVFQRYSVFPHLTAIENVMLGMEFTASPLLGRLFGWRRRAARERALLMLESVGLVAACDRYPAQLSGGMQQRLAIAQSLMMQPKVLLLDEPFGALDPGIRTDMQALVKELWRQHRFTVFMVTHDIGEAFALGTRVLVFDKVRWDPQAPYAYGARITYDIPLDREARQARAAVEQQLAVSESYATGFAVAAGA
jgi:NitT/TauT family transport system ATP-binding protein